MMHFSLFLSLGEKSIEGCAEVLLLFMKIHGQRTGHLSGL